MFFVINEHFYSVKNFLILLMISILCFPNMVWGQFRIKGHVVDSEEKAPLGYVNIGIKKKNVGTITSPAGIFELEIPKSYSKDTLTFSLVGYSEYNLALEDLKIDTPLNIELKQKSTALEEVVVVGKRPKEHQFGIKRRGFLIHFSDGMFNPDDSFEIGQLIKLGDNPVKLTALNLYVLESRDDSATFRVNFYRYSDGEPTERLVEKSIIQRQAINKGWLRFDLANEGIHLSGDVIASLEFLPEATDSQQPISYEVKLGGSSKSFYRRNSLGKWNTPPHHYCLHVTALVNHDAPELPDEDVESLPAFVYSSDTVGDRFHIFVGLPKDYGQDTSKRYPVLFLLDGNAYFDHVKDAVTKYGDKYSQSTTPIVVGIGYENAYLMDSLRVRDYTYPKALAIDSFATSGGADLFYSFITDELIPHIDSRYRTDTSSRTIMGHSFGGYFALYALLRDCSSNGNQHHGFNYYISASPSISYHENYIVAALEKRLKHVFPAALRRKKLYMTMGERELDAETNHLFKELGKTLNGQESFLLETKVYRNTDHLGTAVPSFEDAIPFIYK